jgi:hypothetical protein
MLNTDSKLRVPPHCHTAMRGLLQTKFDVLHYLVSSSIKDVVFTSCGLAMVGSIWGTVAHMVATNYKDNLGVDPLGLQQWEIFGDNLMLLTSTFTFLPVLLLGFFVNRECSRWVDFMNLALGVWGRVEDLSLLLAGAVEGVNDTDTAETRRQYLWRAYRWLNAVHYMSFYGLDTRVGTSPDEVLWDLLYVGLVSEEEARVLMCTPHKMKQVMLSWLACLWNSMLREGVVPASSTSTFMTKLGAIPVIYCENMPNTVKTMLKIVIWMLTLFITMAYPWKLQVAQQCFQPWALISVILLNFCYIGLLSMLTTLEKSPFAASGDCINVDNLLCEVELTTFRCLRADFGRVLVGSSFGVSGSHELDEAIKHQASQNTYTSKLEEYPGEDPEYHFEVEEQPPVVSSLLELDNAIKHQALQPTQVEEYLEGRRLGVSGSLDLDEAIKHQGSHLTQASKVEDHHNGVSRLLELYEAINHQALQLTQASKVEEHPGEDPEDD